MITFGLALVLVIAVIVAALATAGPRAMGHGSLLLGGLLLLATLLNLAPGYYPLLTMPVGLLLLIGGACSCAIGRRRPR